MQNEVMDGQLFKQLIINGNISLRNDIERINQLNVFPVPDGDTGSNMSATMAAGAKALANVEDTEIDKVAKLLARGMLMGARGNSGVILSQLFSGMASGLKGYQAVTPMEFSKALRQGVEQAYAAVINPVEGTILTVAREGADRALSVADSVESFQELFAHYLEELKASLERTPDLLPVLKEVGVIDSGGAGYIDVVIGMTDALNGKFYDDVQKEQVALEAPKVDLNQLSNEKDYGYCTEFIMQIRKMDEFSQKDFVDMITPLGDSLVVVQDENILKVHIHTKTPGDALNIAQHFGFFINLKIENMALQHTKVTLHNPLDHLQDGDAICGHDHGSSVAPSVKKRYAIVAVVNGNGLKETFIEMGVDYIVDGGQTMNPAIEDFVAACDKINTDHIIIIPNNKNVLLSAQTAAKLIEGKDVRVLPAKTIAQGYASLTMFDSTQDVDQNLKDMQNHLQNVKTGEVTYAIRQSVNNGISIEKGDYMGIYDNQIVASHKDRYQVVCSLIKAMVDSESEIITLMIGNDVPPEESELLSNFLEKEFSVEIEIIDGGQEIYSYIIAVE
ncbi:MAG: DAK2 domain-containing protein [Candidatus Izemoplasmatales bacterium]